MSDMSFMYFVKLISKSPLHVLLCLSLACVIRVPHCVYMRDSQSVDHIVHGFQQANTLVLQLQLSREPGNWFAERVGNWLR